MKKIIALLAATLILTSCGKSEEEKILNDLDLEIEEFLENNEISDLDNSGNEKDEIETTEISGSEKNIEKIHEISEEEKEKSGSKETKSIEEFTKCITENGAKAYGTKWCSHCQDQQKMFGDASEFLDFTDCDKNRKACKDAGITGYPTWVINGKQFPGVQSFEKLGEETGCELVK